MLKKIANLSFKNGARHVHKKCSDCAAGHLSPHSFHRRGRWYQVDQSQFPVRARRRWCKMRLAVMLGDTLADYAALNALARQNLEGMVAYSSVAHMGLSNRPRKFKAHHTP